MTREQQCAGAVAGAGMQYKPRAASHDPASSIALHSAEPLRAGGPKRVESHDPRRVIYGRRCSTPLHQAIDPDIRRTLPMSPPTLMSRLMSRPRYAKALGYLHFPAVPRDMAAPDAADSAPAACGAA